MWKTKIAAIALLWGTGIAHAYMPQAGTWVVTSELDGKPGRGLAIDVQNDTLLMQMYAYEASGEPTFYLAVGKMVDSSATAELTRYTGALLWKRRVVRNTSKQPRQCVRPVYFGNNGVHHLPQRTGKSHCPIQLRIPQPACELEGLLGVQLNW